MESEPIFSRLKDGRVLRLSDDGCGVHVLEDGRWVEAVGVTFADSTESMPLTDAEIAALPAFGTASQ